MKHKALILNLKGEYFDQIKAGEKTEEYRLVKPYWTNRLEGKEYDKVIVLRGYPPAGAVKRRLDFPWRGYEIKTIVHPHFGNEPVKVYAIELRKEKPQ